MTETESMEALRARLSLVEAQRDRLRKALLDMGVQPDIVDLIQNVGATIHIERTEPKEQP